MKLKLLAILFAISSTFVSSAAKQTSPVDEYINELISFSTPVIIQDKDLPNLTGQEMVEILNTMLDGSLNTIHDQDSLDIYENALRNISGLPIAFNIGSFAYEDNLFHRFHGPTFLLKALESADQSSSEQPNMSDIPGAKLFMSIIEKDAADHTVHITYEYQLILAQNCNKDETKTPVLPPVARYSVTEKITVPLEQWHILTVATLESRFDNSLHQIWTLIRIRKHTP